MPQIKFNWVDVCVITLLIRICYVGYKRGFLPEIFRYFGLLFALVLTPNSFLRLSGFLIKWIKPIDRAHIISQVLIFLCILLVFKILSLVISFLIKSENIPALSRVVGIVLGVARAFLLSSIILLVAIFNPFEYLQKSVKEKSFFGPYILKIAPVTYKFVIRFYPGFESENSLTDFLKKE